MKPLPRFLLIFLVVGALGYGAYYAVNNTSVGSKLAPSGKQGVSSGSGSVASVDGKKAIGVCVVTWGGYAGGQYFNEGFAASRDSRYYKEYGIVVDFKVIDDFDVSRKAWMADQCQLLWATVDAFPTEAGNLAEFEPKIVFQADWSRGGDAMVVTRDIKNVADLRGKRVALLPASPSHTFLLHALEAGGLNYSDVELVTAQSAPDAAAIFKSGNVKAAVVWSPDDEDAVRNVPGSRVFKSTREASHIIPDIFFVKKAYLESHRAELKSLVEGWLRGAAEINSSSSAKDKAVRILAKGLNISEEDAMRAINNVRLTTYGDNVNFFNLEGKYYGVKGEDVYLKMSRVYGDLGLAKSVPPWRNVTDMGLLRDIKLAGSEHSAEATVKFAAPTQADVSSPAYATKRLSVKFATGSAVLDENAKSLIDMGFAPVAKAFSASRIRIEGNTDITGSDEANRALSQKRAQTVANYLASQYGFDRNRFVVVGNGSSKPVADNDTEAGRAKNRRTDFELLE